MTCRLIDLTLTYQHEDIESPLLGTPLVEQVMETDRLRDTYFQDQPAVMRVYPIGQDDHSMCLNTSIWDPCIDDSISVSAWEDTTTHTGYSMTQRELAIGDDVQSHIGGLSSTVDRGKFSTLSSAKSVFGDCSVGTSSERYEMAPQPDYDQEPHYLAG
jgi:hypothetical protein